MLNHIWALLIVVGIMTAFGNAVYKTRIGETVQKEVNGVKTTEIIQYTNWKQRVNAVKESGSKLTTDMFNIVGFTYTDAAGKTKDGAVGIAVGYIGLMALWLGLMKLAEASGIIAALSWFIAPLFRFVFPSVPRNHPASGAMLMNISANMLGLDNAATPLGIKAMQELQKLNGKKDTASNAICMFLALNVSSLTLIPASIIALRAQQKSLQPASFWPVMLMATAVGKITAFTLCKLYERATKDTPKPGEPGSDTELETLAAEAKA